jgi:hypothetical protein
MTSSHEQYVGGSPDAERADFGRLAHEMMRVQAKNKKASGALRIDRALHAQALLGVENAALEVRPDLLPDLAVGHFRPGSKHRVTVRLSKASGVHQPDTAADLYGAALRITVSPQESQDLLLTNFSVSPARNAGEFVALTRALAGTTSTPGRAFAMLVKLPLSVGWSTANRMRANLQAGIRRRVTSLALQDYWSRGALNWGAAGPVRLILRPAHGRPAAPGRDRAGAHHLRHELIARLRDGDIVFDLCVQRYVSAALTPVEDTSVEWTEQVSPAIRVASLVIPRQDVDSAEARLAARRVDELGFNPWSTAEGFEPLGNLNRARKAVYEASTAHRLGHRFPAEPPLRNVLIGGAVDAAFRALNRRVQWHRLPTELSVMNLSSVRRTLRKENLLDPEPPEPQVRVRRPDPPIPEEYLRYRSPDGTYNDLSAPGMGAVGAVFGRNMAPDFRSDHEPNPFDVSQQLLRRDPFIPAGTLNVLAAAWIQFQVHDWVSHERYGLGEGDLEITIPEDLEWRNTPTGDTERVMRIAADKPRNEGADGPPLFGNKVSHWWDGSEVYGSDKNMATKLRARGGGGAELYLEDGHLPIGERGLPLTGSTDGWWLGLSAMQTLFAREHNAVCEALRREYPRLTEEHIYQTARLVVAALIAKIHTLEWTPAILRREAVDISVKANWQGPPKHWFTQLGLWLSDVQSLRGIPETTPDHHGVPFSLTEEFVTVYRMHPLLPDDYVLVGHDDGRVLDALAFGDVQGAATESVIRKFGLTDTLYSLAIANPGAVTLHNFPNALRRLERGDEKEGVGVVDMAVVDIVRTRHRGIPRYNDFRAGLGMPRLETFEQLTTEPRSLAALRELYKSIDRVDTVVGLLAENPPDGFGFSDTAFRVFILMASRRLQSDRFLTADFRPAIYTPLGLDWVQSTTMSDVLLRHCPELAPMLPRDATPFSPWRLVE